MLSGFHKMNDVLLELGRDLHVLHCSIRSINLLLKFSCFPVQSTYEHCQLAKQIGINNRSHHISESYEEDLEFVPWSQIISCQEKTGGESRHPILVAEIHFEEGGLAPDVVEGWNPNFILLGDVEPDAALDVEVHHEEVDEF